MTQLSPEELAAVASEAGFKGSALTKIVAIMMAESSGNTTAGYTRYTEGTHNSIGIAQINANAHQQYNPEALTNPIYNAEASYQISNGGSNFTPWTTYLTGAYKKYLSAASQAVANLEAASSSTATPTQTASWEHILHDLEHWQSELLPLPGNGSIPNPVPSILGGIGGDIAKGIGSGLGDFLHMILTSNVVIMIAQGLVGGVMIVVGLFMLDSGLTSDAKNVIMNTGTKASEVAA